MKEQTIIKLTNHLKTVLADNISMNAYSEKIGLPTSYFCMKRKAVEQAKEADLQAHTVQTKLIQAEMSGSGNKPEVGLLMVHAQDHYMTSQLARDLIEELINVFEAKEGK